MSLPSVAFLLIMTLCHCQADSNWNIDPVFEPEETSGILTLNDHESAIAAISRTNTCTILLLGARWDGFFQAFVARGRYWQKLAQVLSQYNRKDTIQLAFLEYDGSSSGPRSIPPELLPHSTLGSYDWWGYRGGTRLWEGSRQCLEEHDGENPVHEWNLECLHRLCNSSFPSSSSLEL